VPLFYIDESLAILRMEMVLILGFGVVCLIWKAKYTNSKTGQNYLSLESYALKYFWI